MNRRKVLAIFDIGKTNKKILLFDKNLNVVFQNEGKFKTCVDEDGIECDDIDLIEAWIRKTLSTLVEDKQYDVVGVNFSCYGASLAYLDGEGKRLSPIYNYLKEVSPAIQKELFDKHGGEAEFCRKTASPALGVLLNSGVQILWLKQEKPAIFHKVKSILHFPQYLSYLLTNKVVAESTSIGCHTFLWDFDQMKYHQWLQDQEISLPQPIDNSTTFPTSINGHKINVGIGIHDSSASIAPYIKGSTEKFILISTGTWGINMNPFNNEPLTSEQLKKDTLCYLSINQEQVKSSRLFMGHIHEVNTARITHHFGVDEKAFTKVKADKDYVLSNWDKKVFFKGEMPTNYIDEAVDYKQFKSFEEAYHQLVIDLTRLTIDAIKLIIAKNDDTSNFYISGGFARNEIFVRLIASYFPLKKVFTSEVDNASALGAALVIYNKFGLKDQPKLDLGLKKWDAFPV